MDGTGGQGLVKLPRDGIEAEELTWKFGPTGEEPIEVWRSDEVGRAVRVT